MSSCRFSTLSLPLLVAAGVLSGAPAAADWLVTREGVPVETRGAWEIRGNLVVFHTPDGVFSSMRRDAIDLERSAELTERSRQAVEARKAAPSSEAAEAKPKPKAKFVLTDADVGHVDEAAIAAAAAGDRQSTKSNEVEDGERTRPSSDQPGELESVELEKSPLEVASWNAVLGAGAEGITIRGVVRNPSEYFASGIRLAVAVFGLEGDELGSKSASLDSKALAPGERSSFQVRFPGVFSVGNALFELESFNAVIGKAAEDK